MTKKKIIKTTEGSPNQVAEMVSALLKQQKAIQPEAELKVETTYIGGPKYATFSSGVLKKKGNMKMAKKIMSDMGMEISNNTPVVTVSAENNPMASELKVNLDLEGRQETQDFKDLIGNIQLSIKAEKTHIYLIAIDLKNSKNNIGTNIHSYSGEPFGGYVYERESDSYYIECIEFLDLGFVSCAFEIAFPKIGNWKTGIPLPEPVLERYLSLAQKKNAKGFKERYKEEDKYRLEYVQMRGCV